MAENRPTGMETKSTGDVRLGYIPAELPTETRLYGQLTDDERRRADQHGDLLVSGSGMPAGEADNLGLTTESGGTQETPTATTNKRGSSGGTGSGGTGSGGTGKA